MATSNVAIWQTAIDGLILFIEAAGQTMDLQTRDISTPSIGSVDFDESFATASTFIGAIDTDNKGRTAFDGSNVERKVTQTIYMEYIADVTAENWILYDGRRLDIITVEDIGELNGILKLDCDERGIVANEANKA